MSKLKEKVEEFAEIAKALPENLQVPCFELLLKNYLEGTPHPATQHRSLPQESPQPGPLSTVPTTPPAEGSSKQEYISEDELAPSPVEAAIQRNLGEQIRKLLLTLTPREVQIPRLRFGIGQKTHYTLEEVGKQLAVSRERIRRIEAKALRKLRMVGPRSIERAITES
jgi:hypothetical protein